MDLLFLCPTNSKQPGNQTLAIKLSNQWNLNNIIFFFFFGLFAEVYLKDEIMTSRFLSESDMWRCDWFWALVLLFRGQSSHSTIIDLCILYYMHPPHGWNLQCNEKDAYFLGLRSHAILKSIAWAAILFSLSQIFHFLLFEFFNNFLLSSWDWKLRS